MEKQSTSSHRTRSPRRAALSVGHAKTSREGKRIRLVAIDLDGTLLSSRKTITRATHTAVRAVMEMGVKVVIATARPPRSVRTYYEALQLDTPTINYNGALIWDEKRRKLIEHVPLDFAIAKRVIAFGRKKFADLLVSVEILDKWYTDHYSDIPEYVTETGKHFAPDFIGPLDAFLRVPITKLMLLGNPLWMEELERGVGEKFAAHVAHTRSDPHMLQLMNPTTSKAGALARVAAQMGIAQSEVMALGDAPNDVEMLEWAGLAVVPENAWTSVKRVADAVVPSNDEDGVAVALKRFVLE